MDDTFGEIDLALEPEVSRMAPILHRLKSRFQNKEICAPDLVAGYIIAYCALRYPSRWISGPLPSVLEIKENEELKPRLLLSEVIDNTKITQKQRVLLEQRAPETWTVGSFISRFRLVKIVTTANQCLIEWFSGNRDLVLLFSIPSPLEVLQMQSTGRRCVSALVEADQLRRRIMRKCPLEFIVHDLQHMEKFRVPDFREEQIGLFHCLLQIDFLHFFDSFQYDDDFRSSIDYVASDMNACVIHVFQDFKAKWIIAEETKRQSHSDKITSCKMLSDPIWTKKFDLLMEKLFESAVIIFSDPAVKECPDRKTPDRVSADDVVVPCEDHRNGGPETETLFENFMEACRLICSAEFNRVHAMLIRNLFAGVGRAVLMINGKNN